MSAEPVIPNEIADEEDVARIVCSPYMADDEKLMPTAFYLKGNKETYVSVWRYRYKIPSRENTAFINIPEGNSAYGYALLNVSVCRNVSYKDIKTSVLSYPSKAHPYHAGIHFSKSEVPVKGACADPDFMVVAKMLAKKSILFKF